MEIEIYFQKKLHQQTQLKHDENQRYRIDICILLYDFVFTISMQHCYS